jgi:predicted nucleic acid-binding Zn ribbon protein
MERLFGAIPSVLKNLEPNAKATEAVVFAAWKQAAGDNLSNRTAPVELRGTRLAVTVEDETWRRNLENLAPPLLAKINASLGAGTVTFIEFRVDPNLNNGR